MKKIIKTSLVFTGIIFFAGCAGQQPTPSQNQSAGQTPVAQQSEQKVPGVVPVPKEGPKEVAASYANLTLMTFPADVQAKKYLASDLQSKFDTPGFVPQSYGIQNTPDSIKVGEASVSGNKATVKVVGQFGQTQVIWEFTVLQFNGEWKISKVSKVSQ